MSHFCGINRANAQTKFASSLKGGPRKCCAPHQRRRGRFLSQSCLLRCGFLSAVSVTLNDHQFVAAPPSPLFFFYSISSLLHPLTLPHPNSTFFCHFYVARLFCRPPPRLIIFLPISSPFPFISSLPHDLLFLEILILPGSFFLFACSSSLPLLASASLGLVP